MAAPNLFAAGPLQHGPLREVLQHGPLREVLGFQCASLVDVPMVDMYPHTVRQGDIEVP
jgi:hypothetical protein